MAKKHAFIIRYPSSAIHKEGTIDDYILNSGAKDKYAAIIMELEHRTTAYATLFMEEGNDFVIIKQGNESKIQEYANTFETIMKKYARKEIPSLKYEYLGMINEEELKERELK